MMFLDAHWLRFISLRDIINTGEKDMQEFMPLAIILREISFGILLVGLFYTFGMFLMGRLFAAICLTSSRVNPN